MQTQKKATSYRLTPEAKSILAELADRLGLSREGVLEIAIRDFRDARAENSEKSHRRPQKNP